MDVLWLTPDKPTDISVGRQRIADHLETDGWSVTRLGTTPATVRRSFRERRRYDVVVGTTRAGALAGAALRVAGGPPLVVDHIDPIRQFAETNPLPMSLGVRLLEALSFRVADHVLYVYEEEAERVRRWSANATPTSLGVDFDRFANPDSRIVERAETELESRDLLPNVAIYIGGLEPMYHIEELVQAATHLEDWSLVIIGTGSLEGMVRETARTTPSLEFVAPVSHEDIPSYLHLADVGISLVDDPHTLKVLEYGAAGLPVLQLEGRAEEKFGDLVTYTSKAPEDIAAGIRRASSDQAGPLEEFVREFDWQDIARTYKTVIMEAIDDNPPEPGEGF